VIIKKKIILLVDDSAANLTVANALLSEIYTVYTAISGIRMFKLLEKIRPDLILLDIEMPEMDGYEVLKRLKSEADTSGIPVIFLTAHSVDENEPLNIPLGAAGYITKPFSSKLLLDSIENVFVS